MNKEPYSSLYKILGFYPDNIHLYEQAFLHKSSSVESGSAAGKWKISAGTHDFGGGSGESLETAGTDSGRMRCVSPYGLARCRE